MIRVLCKSAGLLLSLLGGLLASAIFKKVWKLAAGEDEAPTSTDARRGWREVLLAVLQGVIFSLVRAVIDRAAAQGTAKITGAWSGEEDEQPGKDA